MLDALTVLAVLLDVPEALTVVVAVPAVTTGLVPASDLLAVAVALVALALVALLVVVRFLQVVVAVHLRGGSLRRLSGFHCCLVALRGVHDAPH